MKTKTYIFTEEEIMTLREAMTEYCHVMKNVNPTSPIAIRNKKNAVALKEQFKNDATLI